MAREISVTEKIKVGLILRAYREDKGLAQADIANMLGYSNPNFISMLESGRSNIPLGKIADVVNVYQLKSEVALVIIKKVHPDLWELFTKLILQNKKLLNSNITTLNRKLDATYEKLLERYEIESSDFEAE